MQDVASLDEMVAVEEDAIHNHSFEETLEDADFSFNNDNDGPFEQQKGIIRRSFIKKDKSRTIKKVRLNNIVNLD